MSCAVMVLGASGGVGRATVERLVAVGIPVAAVGRSPERLHDLGDRETVTTHVLADATDPEQCRAALADALGAHGDVAALITAGGSYEASPLAGGIDPEVVRRMLAANLIAPLVLSSVMADHLRLRGGGRIVHVTSVTAFVTRGGYTAYEAAKAGLVAATRSSAIDLAVDGISVNSVAPGWVRTPMAAEFLDHAPPEDVAALIPAGRASEASEVAETVLWLATAAPATLTGQTIIMDGGQSVRTGHLDQVERGGAP